MTRLPRVAVNRLTLRILLAHHWITQCILFLQLCCISVILVFYSVATHALSCGPVYASKYNSSTGTSYPQLYVLNGTSATVAATATQNLQSISETTNTNIYFNNDLNLKIGQFTGTTTTLFASTWQSWTTPSGAGGLIDGNSSYVGGNHHLYQVNTTGIIADLGVLSAITGDTIFSTLQYGDLAGDGNGRLFLYSSASGNGASYLYRIDKNTLKATNLGQYGPNGASGAAFDNTDKLITTYGTSVFKTDLSAPTAVGTNLGTVTGFSPGEIVMDLASCNFPIFDPQITVTKTVANITKVQTPATAATANDVLEYTITITNTGNIAADTSTLSDSIPAGTTYVTGTTTLNTTAVGDVSGKMFYDPASASSREIHTTGQPTGLMLVGSGNSAIVKFRVKVNSSGLPASISNQATANYPKVAIGTTNFVDAISNLSATPTSDFGDAPATYDTGTATRHIIPTSPTIYLGTIAPDFETSASPPLIGTGDDVTGIDDEDGVTLPANLMLSSTNSVPVVIKGAGYLNAWFDWNRDGDFSDVGEQTATDQSVAAGTTNLSISVPFGASVGTSYARFRLCSTAASCNTSSGNASDGEIEDYQITISTKITGTVFEDINYNGGNGRSLTAALGIGLNTVRVELYDSTGSYVSSTLTDATGKYTLYAPLSSNPYYVRIVNNTVPSSRVGYVAGLLPVQTYRTDALSGTVTAIIDHVGGEDPTRTDAGNGAVGAVLNTSTFIFSAGITGQAQSITPVKVNASISGIDFGYNFDTIVNTRDRSSGNCIQGSLCQFIQNANRLSGADTSIFMISDGNAHPGLRAGLTNQLTGGVAVISTDATLPPSTDSNTSIDGTTQTALVGDTNSTSIGSGGSVGVDSISLSLVNGPEVQIAPSIADTIVYGLDLQGSGNKVRGLAVYGFGKKLITNPSLFSGNIHVTSSNTLIEQNLLGTTAKSFVAPSAGWSYGSGIVAEGASNGTINNNLIGFHDGTGIVLRQSSGFSISNNEIRGNDLHDYGSMDGISTISSGGNHTIIGNLVINNGACGIDNSRQDNLIIHNNTVKGNGVSKGLGQTSYAGVETPGIRLGGSLAHIERNIIEANYGAGILVRSASSGNNNNNPTRNTISQNSIFQNGAISNRKENGPSRQIGIDLEVPGQSTNQGTALFITPNNGANPGLPNGGVDYPVITNATVLGQVLTVSGYIGDSGPVASFGGATIEFFIGDFTDYMQPSVQVISSNSSAFGNHWEGKTYLGNCLAYSDGSFSCALNRPVVGNVFDISNISLTATSTDGSTSEFGDRIPKSSQDSISGVVFLDTGKGGGAAVANNGILEGGETGIANVQISLSNCTSHALLGSTVTDGTGAYNITIPIGTAANTPFCLEERNATHPVNYLSTGASQTSTQLSSTPSAAGVTYIRSTDIITLTYYPGNSYNTLNFGDVPVNQFITDGVKNGSPGNTLWYTHSFTASTQGTVTFSLPTATASPAIPGWSEVLYTDTNCNGTLDSGENQTVTSAITVLQDQKICLLVKEFIPAIASFGATNLMRVKADFSYTDALPTLSANYTRQNLTTVSDGALDLKKRVRNVTTDGTDTPNWQVNNTAKSGEIIEYQITYSNNGATPINALAVKDATPAYTTFVSALADSFPNNLTACSKTTPMSATPLSCSATDTAGGVGNLEWKFTGTLAPGSEGTVTFKVKLN